MDKPIVLITGVSGRIGTSTSKALLPNYHVIGFDIVQPSEPIEGLEFIYTDLSSKKSVNDAVERVSTKYGAKIASCVHLAAYYNFEGGAWEKYQAITIDGTDHLLDALAELQLEQFVFSSTILVYAPCKKGKKINEASPVDPKWEYPLSKVKTEQLIKEKKQSASSVVLRIAGIYDDECNSIPISQHIYRIYKKKIESHFFPGNPDHGASFMHMDDLVEAIQLIVGKRSDLGGEELFVLGEPQVMSFQDLQDEIGRLLHGKPWWTLRIPKTLAKIGAFLQDKLPFFPDPFIKPWMVDLADDHYDLDTRNAEMVLGWRAKHFLKKSLPIMVEKMLKDPKKWAEKHKISG